MQLLAENLSITIGKAQIVNDVSLKVLDGQFVGIIGANGCGKSTLLKSIYKSIKPMTGSVYLGDINVLEAPNKKVSRNLSVVAQFNELSFDLSVYQMVLLGRTPHKKLMEADTKEDHDIAHDALTRTGLTEYENRSYLTLSGGEKQRVILARAIAQQPSFLVLDEPTNHLDIRYQLEILTIVKGLGIGVLAALHDLSMAAEYCDCIYAMKKGKVVASGAPKEVLNESLIEFLYDIKCRIYTNPITDHLGFVYNI